jgi:DNA invertase Pin-like site-specific DNA recombinase
MARTFAYCRVSTRGQTVENQIREIEAAGFHVEKRRLVTETVWPALRGCSRTTSVRPQGLIETPAEPAKELQEA